MYNNNFKLLNQRKIIDVLIGDTVIEKNEEYTIQMPYLSGNDLCQLSTEFGLAMTYSWNGGALSRWMYMQNLLDYTNDKKNTDQLLCNMFNKTKFSDALTLSNSEEVQRRYGYIVTKIIDYINSILYLGNHELKFINNDFIMGKIGEKITIESPKVSLINVPYIQGLKERCNYDMEAGNFDSVITKSRTLMEEVLIYILECNKNEIEAKGDLLKLYKQVKELLNLSQNKSYDGRINNLLSGLEKIVQSIAEMRNMNSDAHGVGSKRIKVREHEARLIINAAITFSEYIITVYNNSSIKENNIENS